MWCGKCAAVHGAPALCSKLHYEILVARLAFVLVFEHVVLGVKWLMAYAIPDVPMRVRQMIAREVWSVSRGARMCSGIVL